MLFVSIPSQVMCCACIRRNGWIQGNKPCRDTMPMWAQGGEPACVAVLVLALCRKAFKAWMLKTNCFGYFSEFPITTAQETWGQIWVKWGDDALFLFPAQGLRHQTLWEQNLGPTCWGIRIHFWMRSTLGEMGMVTNCNDRVCLLLSVVHKLHGPSRKL